MEQDCSHLPSRESDAANNCVALLVFSTTAPGAARPHQLLRKNAHPVKRVYQGLPSSRLHEEISALYPSRWRKGTSLGNDGGLKARRSEVSRWTDTGSSLCYWKRDFLERARSWVRSMAVWRNWPGTKEREAKKIRPKTRPPMEVLIMALRPW